MYPWYILRVYLKVSQESYFFELFDLKLEPLLKALYIYSQTLDGWINEQRKDTTEIYPRKVMHKKGR